MQVVKVMFCIPLPRRSARFVIQVYKEIYTIVSGLFMQFYWNNEVTLLLLTPKRPFRLHTRRRRPPLGRRLGSSSRWPRRTNRRRWSRRRSWAGERAKFSPRWTRADDSWHPRTVRKNDGWGFDYLVNVPVEISCISGSNQCTTRPVFDLTHLQQAEDEGELDKFHEYEENAAEHPDIEVRDVAYARDVLKWDLE